MKTHTDRNLRLTDSHIEQFFQVLIALLTILTSSEILLVNRVVENCSSLQRLRLSGGRDRISSRALGGLANLCQLRELDLGLCVNVSQHTLKEIGSKLKLLVILSLAGCPRVTMANLLYLCGCVSLEALCLVGCKAVYPHQASVIAQELINGGCSRLAMIEAGNQLPNAAPFPARPPPPPPFLYPAQGVAFKDSGSPTVCPASSEAGEDVPRVQGSHASAGLDQQMPGKPLDKDVRACPPVWQNTECFWLVKWGAIHFASRMSHP